MPQETFAVLGGGTMGGGIAQMLAENTCNVVLWDVDRPSAEGGRQAVLSRLDRRVAKGTISEDTKDAVVGRIDATADLDRVSEAFFVVEAVVEDGDVKKDLFARLEAVVSPETVIGTNTSSLSVTSLAEAFQRPERFLGTHFFNPPTKLLLVEVVTHSRVEPSALERAENILTACGKTSVRVADSPGFIVNRLLLPMINEAARLLDEGVADAESIDTAMRLGALHPAGPLLVADLIGLDVCETILNQFADKLGSQWYGPAASISGNVRRGRLGRKTGGGFHEA